MTGIETFFGALAAGAGSSAAAGAGTAAVAGSAAAAGTAAAGTAAAGTAAAAGLTFSEGLALASAALGAASAVDGALAAKQSGEYNAAALEIQAKQERQQAAMEAEEERRRGEVAIGQQRSLLAASGADLSFGTALLAQEDLAGETALRSERILMQGDRTAANTRTRANLSRGRGRSAARAGYTAAGTSLLSGASEVSGTMY